MTFRYRYRKQILIGVMIIILLGGTTFLFVNKSVKSKSKVENKPVLLKSKKETTEKKEEMNDKEIKVDIKGQILTPGIYTLKSGSRIIDVIQAAGGLTTSADTTVINLSKKITDEMVIIIYSNNEVKDFKKTKQLEAQVIEKCVQQTEEGIKNDACINTDSTSENKTKESKIISLNSASLEDLTTLPGIGESKAQDIISYRDSIGGFKTIEEIKNVTGIGDSTFAKIKDLITL